jgi:ankyrin repeat protein
MHGACLCKEDVGVKCFGLCCPAAHGHLDVLKAVVEVLQSSRASLAGCGTGDLKEPTIDNLSWKRFVKDVMNARTSQGKTPLMLACERG